MLLLELTTMQNWSLPKKIQSTKERVKEWYEYWEGQVYVSFSGGKDSTVLLNLVRSIYPDIEGVFVDTGLEYPEIRSFVKTFDNITWLRPKVPFHKIIEKYGYPVVSKDVSQKIDEIRNTKSEKLRNKRLFGDDNGVGKISEKWKYLIKSDFKISHKCCAKLKKDPLKKYEKLSGKKPIVGTLTKDSRQRMFSYLRTGCNSFQTKRPMSVPLSFWEEKDIWKYLKEKKLSYCSIYEKGHKRTGCMFCMFGVHLEKEPNRFQKMKKDHPKQYNYCINKLGCGKVLDAINVNYKKYIKPPTLFDEKTLLNTTQIRKG
jgi:3'-phosphoadenosine 5'-phosphosulfate sulfotransferase (PAPS reductase)/FAD synthetase